MNNTEFDHIWFAYISGKFDDTIEYCRKKITEDGNILWYALISHAYYANYQYRLGLFYNQKALSILNSESEESISGELHTSLTINHASILAELGRETGNKFYLFEAVDIWIELIEKEQLNDSSLFYNFANTCLLLQKLELAEIYFLKSLDLDQNNSQTWTNLADVYAYKEDFKKELKCYQKAIKIDKTLKNALIGEAIALYHLGKYKKSLVKFSALKKYEREWRINYSDYYYYLSELYEKLSQPEKSINIAEDGLYYDPGNIKLINKLSDIYSHLWKTDQEIKIKAKRLYLKRLQIYTDDLRALGELVNMKITEGLSIEEIANFIKSHIRLEEGVTDEEIVESFKEQSAEQKL